MSLEPTLVVHDVEVTGETWPHVQIEPGGGLHVRFRPPLAPEDLLRAVREWRLFRLRSVKISLYYVEDACSVALGRELSAWAEDPHVEHFAVSGERGSVDLDVGETRVKSLKADGCSIRVRRSPNLAWLNLTTLQRGKATHWDELFGSAPRLSVVLVAGSSALKTLRGFPPNVNRVEIGYMRSLAELGGLKAENLRVLKFNRCPALDLDSLCANGCPPELFVRLMDIKRPGIGRLAARGLTGLHLIDSDVSDDDLEPLVGVPDLQMNWKKHYPITQDEFDARRAAVGLTSSRWQVG